MAQKLQPRLMTVSLRFGHLRHGSFSTEDRAVALTPHTSASCVDSRLELVAGEYSGSGYSTCPSRARFRFISVPLPLSIDLCFGVLSLSAALLCWKLRLGDIVTT